MIRKSIGIALTILFIMMISSCDNTNKTVNNTSIQNSNDNVIVGSEYKFRGLTNIYDSTNIFNGAKVISRQDTKGTAIVKEINGDFAKIDDLHGTEGWVFKWYLTTTAGGITPVKRSPYEKVIKENCSFYTFPKENESDGYELKKGDVVHIMEEYNDWYCVELIKYEDKTYVDKWVKKSNTIDLKDSDIKVENPFEYERTKIKEEIIDFIQKAEKIDALSLATSECFAQIKGEDIKTFAGLIKDTTIESDPLGEDEPSDMKCELAITGQNEKISIMLAKNYLLYFPSKRWQENQNCLIFNNDNIYNQIEELLNKK